MNINGLENLDLCLLLIFKGKFREISGARFADVEILLYPGILVPRKYLSWQKIFVKVTTLNYKIEYNVR